MQMSYAFNSVGHRAARQGNQRGVRRGRPRRLRLGVLGVLQSRCGAPYHAVESIKCGSKAYATLLMCLRGSVCIYQGEELGLPEAEIAFEDLQDPYGKQFWPEFKGRDGCRTPMVWESDNQNGAFSTQKPWLPVPSSHLALAAHKQEQDPAGLVHHYRRAIALRHAFPALRSGDQPNMQAEGNVLRFERVTPEQRFCRPQPLGNPETIQPPRANGSRSAPILAPSRRGRMARCIWAVAAQFWWRCDRWLISNCPKSRNPTAR